MPGLQAICEATRTPLFKSPKACSAVIDLLHLYLARRFADTVSAHGVFMDVFGMGVLITGDSGIGKSELALELVSRGHSWLPTTLSNSRGRLLRPSKAVVRECSRIIWRCADSGCSTSAQFLARRPHAEK